MNNWKSIWNNRASEQIRCCSSLAESFLELKRVMGVASADETDFAAFSEQFQANLSKMELLAGKPLRSFFEVGCGSGAYLFYLGMQDPSLSLGGMDYSAPLIGAAKSALRNFLVRELYCQEAIEITTSIHYDCVFSRSVFQYFPNQEYGIRVAEKMLEKTSACVGFLDLFDVAKREDFLAYRRSVIKDYDEKYANTPHQFYAKEDFLRLAEAHHCDILFSRDPLKGYWNEPFVFDVYLSKRS